MVDDILRGGEAIARALGLPRRSIYHHAEVGRLPTFRIGAMICARRSAVVAWLAACEATSGARVPRNLVASVDKVPRVRGPGDVAGHSGR